MINRHNALTEMHSLMQRIDPSYKETLLLFEDKIPADEIRQKYYQDIDRGTFDAAVKSDPTAKGEGIGKYTKWILNLVRQGKWKPGDQFETRSSLERFAKIGKKLPKRDIQMYDSVAELCQALRDAGEVKTRTEVKTEGAEKVYEDSDWTVIHPITEEAAVFYGRGTKWCTAAVESNNMFDEYNNEGPLYIIISKKHPGLKWQFHVESGSFMDAEDEESDAEQLSGYGNTEGLFRFIQSVDTDCRFFPSLIIARAMEELANGADPNDVFDEVGVFSEGYAWVELNGKYNFINRNGEFAFPDQWYDDARSFSEGYAVVVLYGKGWNWINRNGEIAFPNQWYDDAGDFIEGYAWVELGGKWYKLRKDGVLCYNDTQPIEGGDRLEEAIDRVIKRMLR